MLNVTETLRDVNLALLTEEVRTLLGDLVYGTSSDNEMITLHLADGVTEADINAARNLLIQHDPTKLTAEQTQQRESAARLLVLREANRLPLDLASYQNADANIRQLAERLTWLELEIAMRS